MFDKDYPYTLRVEGEENAPKHYYVSFSDGQAVLYEMEIDFNLYKEFRRFERQNKKEQNFYDRHVEHSELTEETLTKRTACPPKSVEEQICDNEHSAAFWSAVGELPEIQQRRFLYYYDDELTYEQIAEMEGCTKRAVKFSVDIAKDKILEKIKKL